MDRDKIITLMKTKNTSGSVFIKKKKEIPVEVLDNIIDNDIIEVLDHDKSQDEMIYLIQVQKDQVDYLGWAKAYYIQKFAKVLNYRIKNYLI
jgi:hypothetical protein